MKKLILLTLIFILTATTVNAEDKAYGGGFAVHYTAASVLVMDANTGEVLYEHEGFTQRFPASITKVMTALLVIEATEDFSQQITISANAANLPHYAGRMGLVAGENITILEALYGIMLPSANEIARALAEHISGDIPSFVEKMNERAWELGAYYTRFINPCGLPGDNQFVTAYDIALIMQEAISHPLFVDIISTPYFTLPPTNIHDEPRLMRNSNVMVRPTQEAYNPRAIGGKTGFTIAAQHTLVSYAAYNGNEIIISVLYGTPRGVIFADTAALIEYIFDVLLAAPPEPEVDDTEEAPHIPIIPATPELQSEEAIHAFAPYTIQYTPPPPPREVTTTEAVTVAAMSAVSAAIALFGVFLFHKKTR